MAVQALEASSSSSSAAAAVDVDEDVAAEDDAEANQHCVYSQSKDLTHSLELELELRHVAFLSSFLLLEVSHKGRDADGPKKTLWLRNVTPVPCLCLL